MAIRRYGIAVAEALFCWAFRWGILVMLTFAKIK
jgi:hypothetical protein